MKKLDKLYVNGQWRQPIDSTPMNIVDPSSEKIIGQVDLAGIDDVDQVVNAAKNAFVDWSQSTKAQRLALFDNIIAKYSERMNDMAHAISTEMGAPISMALGSQAPIGLTHFETAREVLRNYNFEEALGNSQIYQEPIGVCAFITPWNWPINQIVCKVAPALACGCTIILKPSELAPLSAQLFIEILHDAGVPAGVINMIYGDGPTVGAALSEHPDVDMVSLTGSTRAGVQVSKAAADTVKRVALELGGKSANIICKDSDLEKAVKAGAAECFNNTGQSCNAPTRMLVPAELHDQAVQFAVSVAESSIVGDPRDVNTKIGPLSNLAQFNKVQSMIQQAIDAGSELVAGGPGRPQKLTSGYFARPTVFANVDNQMMIAREEVFGPVLVIMPYDNEAHAIEIANDSPYGLAAYVQSNDQDQARRIAKRLRVGTVFLNGNNYDPNAPFGGYKQSGNGREWGRFAFHDFLEIKGVVGFNSDA